MHANVWKPQLLALMEPHMCSVLHCRGNWWRKGGEHPLMGYKYMLEESPVSIYLYRGLLFFLEKFLLFVAHLWSLRFQHYPIGWIAPVLWVPKVYMWGGGLGTGIPALTFPLVAKKHFLCKSNFSLNLIVAL